MRSVAGVALALMLAGCSQGAGSSPDARPTNCGLLAVKRSADPALIPEALRLGGTVEVATTEIERGRLLAAINVRLSVDDSFEAYRKASKEAGLEILQEDNEGFEAELYVGAGKELGSVVIRRSLCEDAVVVYLNLPAGEERSP